MWIGGLLVSYTWSFHIQARIAEKLYKKGEVKNDRPTREQQNARSRDETKQAIEKEFTSWSQIDSVNPFSRYLGLCCKKSKYGKELRF